MAIQCGICKNVMPSSSFLSHKERKHSMERRVSYIELPDNVLKTDRQANNGQLIKCRHCPNRIPENAMERHLKRSHIDCHLCGKTFQKTNFDKHMQQKHGFMGTSSLSQSKSSIQSDSDLASTMDFMRDSSPVSYQPAPTPSLSSFEPSSSKANSDVIRVNEWELHRYIRQGRVYTKNGCLYLRNVDCFQSV